MWSLCKSREGNRHHFLLIDSRNVRLMRYGSLISQRTLIKKRHIDTAQTHSNSTGEQQITCFNNDMFRLPVPRPGQVLGLVGTNGIGKSTALKVLAGKLKPNLGKFSVQIHSYFHFILSSGASGLGRHFGIFQRIRITELLFEDSGKQPACHRKTTICGSHTQSRMLM